MSELKPCFCEPCAACFGNGHAFNDLIGRSTRCSTCAGTGRVSRAAQITPQAGEAEPVGYEYQHDETGRTTMVDIQQVEWGFEENNPRLQRIGPLYRHPPRPVCPHIRSSKDGTSWCDLAARVGDLSPVAPELDINTPKHTSYDPEAPENRPHPPVPLGCKGEGFDSEGEPWYGHQFKALLAGRWKCERGKMLYDTPPSPVAPVWQPIETAPRDGTRVDIWYDGERYTDCVWLPVRHCFVFDDSDGMRQCIDGTHWMPLPEPPSPPDSPGAEDL